MWRRAAAAVGIAAVGAAAATWVTAAPSARAPVGTGDGWPVAVSHAAALRTFGACADLTDWLARNALPHVEPWGLAGAHGGWGWGFAGVVVDDAGTTGGDAVAALGAAQPMAARASAAPAFSGTNVQEVGVDEPDTVKTDGRRLFTVREGRLHQVDLTGDEPRLAASVPLGDDVHGEAWQADLLLAGDRLLVTWASWSHEGPQPLADAPRGAALTAIAPGTPRTQVRLFDVSGEQPVLLEQARLDGNLVTGRLHGDSARLVLRSHPDRLPLVAPTTGDEDDARRAVTINRAAVRGASAEQWLPWMEVTDLTGARPVTFEQPMTRCEDVHHPGVFSGFGTLNVLTVPLQDGLADAHATSVLTGADTVYASTERLYVASYAVPQPPPWEERMRGAPAMEPLRPQDFSTELHAFDVTDPASTSYLGSGEVAGHVLNQFALSEHDGHLRVATTVGAPWAGGSESGVHVLRLVDGRLQEVGHVGDLGRGERIYAVRYLGDVGYVVTFRQVDPLYTIDLSDPSHPQMVGELKIPGYSAYLHPVGEGFLLGVGQDATEQGQVLGTQLSLFDVRDLAHPKQVAKTVIRQGHSEAEFDHHAFLHWPATGVTVVPVSTWEPTPWSGAMAFRVDGSDLERLGEVTHDQAMADEIADPWARFDRGRITRSLVVGDDLLTLSQEGLQVNDLETLATEHWLVLR